MQEPLHCHHHLGLGVPVLCDSQPEQLFEFEHRVVEGAEAEPLDEADDVLLGFEVLELILGERAGEIVVLADEGQLRVGVEGQVLLDLEVGVLLPQQLHVLVDNHPRQLVAL